MNNIKKQFKTILKKPMLLYSIGCLLLLVASVFLVYYVRVIYSPLWLGQTAGTACVFIFFALIILSVLMIYKIAKQNRALLMAGLIFISGVLFVFINPPNQTPDEQSHFLRSYAMAMGDWHFDKNQEWPNDVNLLMDNFHVAYNNGYPAKENNTIYNRFIDYKNDINTGVQGEGIGIIIFQSIPYIPQAIGIFIARLLGIGALGCYYFARLGNLFIYCGLCYLSLSMAKRFTHILFAVMIMPLCVFLAGSCSNDALLLGLMFLCFGTVLRESFQKKQAIILAVAMAVLVTSKLSFMVFYLLVFAIPKKSWDIKLKPWQYLLICLGGLFIVYKGMAIYVSLASNYGEIPRTMQGSDPTLQLEFILKNPFRYMAVFADTLKNNAFFLFSGGLLGWIDVNIPLINYFTPIVLLFSAFNNSPEIERQDVKLITGFFICAVMTYAVVLTGLYISWAPVTLPQIIGVQARYILPGFIGILLPISYYFSKYTLKSSSYTARENSVIAVSFVFCILAAMLLFSVYYLPQRMSVYVS